MTDAHDQKMTLNILAHIPAHDPREKDPNYKYFNQAKARIKKTGMWKCIINDDLCSGEPELHHSFVEFSQIANMDPAKIEAAFGLHFESDDDFQKWIESPGNLEVLCAAHHRTHFGIHSIPAPLWETFRFRKTGTEPAAEVITEQDK